MDSALCDSGLLRARDAQFSRLKALFDGGQNERVFFLQGINAKPTTDPYREPERWVDEGLRSLAEQSGRLKDEVVFRPLCLEFGPYGVHFVDRMFGARVYHHEGQWWSDCLKMPVGTLEPPDLERDETWRLARRVADAFLAR
ncbi:MAG: hypothetical protein FJ278_08740, partial [Planctomycetes bacterium]|nr:hypothetical protein [Planctomycetota bacterium]